MTNAEYIVNMLMGFMEEEGIEFKRESPDDGGASMISAINYNIVCPYYSGDTEARCHVRTVPNEDDCLECKCDWLSKE